MTEEKSVEISLSKHIFPNRTNLIRSKLVTHEMQVFDGNIYQKLLKNLTADTIVVNVKSSYFTLLKTLHKSLSSMIINIIVLKLKIVKITSFVHKTANQFATS